ncbi:WG repeat-containing protein [Paenibacillus terrae]|uniref:WG repeat-containing protein n=1 Tax=Paenibacillus terrae TaxID=159743 RepID=UPI0011EB7797|nr:WG repeat-containing protein [Paenibacillus terrae]
MKKKVALALLLLCTAFTTTSTGFASSNTPTLEVSQTPLDYSMVIPESDGNFHDGLLFAEQSNGSLVYYNAKGKEAFTLPDYISPVSDFNEQRALVKNNKTNLYGFINTKGQLAIPCQYTDAGNFSEGLAHVITADNKSDFLIDRTGKTVTRLTQKYSSDYHFTYGLALVYNPKGDKIGFINKKGQLAIPYHYATSRGFYEGLALVKSSKGMYGYIDTTGKVVIPLQYKSGGDFSEGLAAVQNTKGQWGFINKLGKNVIPFRYTDANYFSEGLAAVYNQNGKVGFIDPKGKLVIVYQKYTRAESFKEGIALVGVGTNSDGKFGYIDRQGKLLTKLQYLNISSSFANGYAVASKEQGIAFLLTKHLPSK